MIIKNLQLVEGINEANDKFSDSLNLITSANKNSVGKSTYCRLIFYSLGFQIPSTENINFEKIFTKIELEERNKNFTITRQGKFLTVEILAEKFVKKFELPEQHISFLSFLINNDNIRVLKNLLGLMYIDQEKGWTLLNRGKVIGNIRFSIDELVSGLKNIDCEDLFKSREIIENQINKYNSLINLNEIKERYYKENNNLELTSRGEDIQKEIATLQLSINVLNKKIRDIDEVLKQDKNFFDYIESMRLFIRTPEKLIQVTKDNIENNLNIEFLKAQKSILLNQCHDLEKRKALLVRDYEAVVYGSDLLKENTAVDVEKGINVQLSSLNLDISSIKSLLEKGKQELNQLNIRIRERVRQNNEYISEIYNRFVENSKELGIEKSISKNIDYIFTSDLKCRTGANFQKLIIAYKIAVLQVAEKVLKTKLIFVIDSPKSKELDNENTKIIMKFIKNKLSKNQVFVFSIYPEKSFYVKFDNVMTLKNRAIESDRLIK